MISKEMISAGIRLGIIRFVPAPNACMGTVCQIGEHWFCLSDLTAAEQSPDEYLASMTTEALADEVYETLYSFMDPDELSDEYAYNTTAADQLSGAAQCCLQQLPSAFEADISPSDRSS